MTDPTPTPVATPAPAPAEVAAVAAAIVATTPAVKPWYAQWSNYAGVAIGIIGNALPYITPDFLTSIGVTPTAAHTIGSIVAVILVAYKEKAKPVSTPTQENPK